MKLNIGENIRSHRKKLGWTQEQLAERLGVSYQSVSRWENGTTYPDIEHIPQIARTFGITTDALLGCLEPEEKLSYPKLTQIVSSTLYTEDPQKAIQMLRMLKYEYYDLLTFLLNQILSSLRENSLKENAEFMEELRGLVEDYLAHDKAQASKPLLIHSFACIEDDEHFDAFISRHHVPPRWDISHSGLRLARAREKGDGETVRKITREKKFAKMVSLLKYDNDRAKESPEDFGEHYGDPVYWRKISEMRLDILHLYNGEIPEESHPVSSDGQLDLWAEVRISIGFAYASQLTATGDEEFALTVLEDCTSLLEQALDFSDEISEQHRNNTGFYPNDMPPLTCTAPELKGISGCRLPMYVPAPGGMSPTPSLIRIILTDNNHYDYAGNIMVSYDKWLTDTRSVGGYMRSEWFDSVRNHPRYESVVKRLKKCAGRSESESGTGRK